MTVRLLPCDSDQQHQSHRFTVTVTTLDGEVGVIAAVCPGITEVTKPTKYIRVDAAEVLVEKTGLNYETVMDLLRSGWIYTRVGWIKESTRKNIEEWLDGNDV